MKKISVCVICYNQETYILQCLSSIINQKGEFNLEVVIRDDCSSDRTYEICKNYIKNIHDDRITIKLLDSSINLGANKNSMQVLKNCTGDFIAFCEGDDYWTSETKLQQQLNFANKHNNINLFVHPAYYHYSDGRLEKKCWPSLDKEILPQSRILLSNWQFAPTSSYFIRSSIISKLPIWYEDATIGDIYIEIYTAYNGIGVIDKYLSAYRYLSVNSWSLALMNNTPKILKQKIKHYNNFIQCLNFIKSDFPELVIEITIKEKNIMIQLAKLYFLLNDKNSGQEILEIIKSGNELSIKEKLILHLIKYPKLINLISKVKKSR